MISNNEIKDISAFERFVFKIDHTKEGRIKFFFNSKTENNHYSIETVDRKNKIYKVRLNQNPETYFVNKDNIKSIKQINYEPKDQSYQLKNLSKVFDYNLEASEYENEKEKEYPNAIWITINKKTIKNGKRKFDLNLYPGLCSKKSLMSILLLMILILMD